MNDDFKKAIGDISNELRSLMQGGVWEEDLEAALSSIELTDAQHSAIKQAASPTFFQDFTFGETDVKPTLSSQLAHAFRDPVAKSSLSMELTSRANYDGATTLEILTQARTILEDITHNYPLILGEDMPRDVQDILDGYKTQIIPKLSEHIDALSAETGIDAASFAPPTIGVEHLSSLPDDAFTNGMANE